MGSPLERSSTAEGQLTRPRRPEGTAVAEIQAGACGFTTVVKTLTYDGRHVEVTLESECANIRRVAAELGEVDAYEEISWRKGKRSAIHEAMAAHARHTACPVTSGIIKAVEVCTRLAIPADVSIKITSG